MKKTPRTFGTLPEKGSTFSKSERNKLIFFSVLLVLVLAAFLSSRLQQGKYEQQRSSDLPEEEFVEQLALPEFDLSQVQGKVADADRDDRVLLESEPYEAMFRFVGEYGQVYFRAAPVAELDAAALATLRADPAPHRGEAYRVRGSLEELKSRVRPDGAKEHRGWVRTESGEVVHFRLHELEEGLIGDDFVRLDGMFLKQYEAEGADGWEVGPLLVGARAVRSYPNPEALGPEKIRPRLALVEDDTLDEKSGLEGDNFDAHWILMNRALDAEDAFHPKHGAIAWEDAPELTNEVLAALQKPGGADEYRGMPFRVPISRNMDARTLDPGENPARVDRVTQGWIGNMVWTTKPGVITYSMPAAAPELRGAHLVKGRGYFLKNVAYEPRDGGRNIAPYFVLTSLEPHVPGEDRSTRVVLYFVAGVTVLLVVLIPVLLLRDRRKSEQLHRELVRRRQERRARLGDQTGSRAGS